MRIVTSLRRGVFVCALLGCTRTGLPTVPARGSALGSVCEFERGADPTRAVLAFTVDHDVRFTFADGTTRTAYTFASLLPSATTAFIGRVDDVEGERVVA